ncbi:hypothetical protein B0H12DRAFT_1245696 [Mycena haematopus]|nr:hypothetical protein B0H12DRAFT_1245696 [Mycena haematopus]
MSFYEHCRFFLQDASSIVGEEVFFNSPDTFEFSVPPYHLTSEDLAFPPSRPLFPVIQGETGLGAAELTQDEMKSVYFLLHPAVIRLLPFLRYPSRLSCTSAEYLSFLLNASLHSFCILLIRGCLAVVLHVQREAPNLVNPDWFVLRMEHTDEFWMERAPLSPTFRFPWVVEFAPNHPVLPPQLDVRDHHRLAAIRSPELENLLSLISQFPRVDTPVEIDAAVSQITAGFSQFRRLFNSEFVHNRLTAPFIYRVVNNFRGFVLSLSEARRSPRWLTSLPIAGPAQRNFHFPEGFIYPSGPHESEITTPFPSWNSVSPTIHDPLVDLWDHHQRSLIQDSQTSPPACSSAPPPSEGQLEGTSPMYEPSSPTSPLRPLSPVSPRTAETSALLRDNTLSADQALEVLRSRIASRTPGLSADAGGESTLPSQTLDEAPQDAPMSSVEVTPPAIQAFPSPPRSSAVFRRIASFRDANNPLANFVAYGPGERRSSRPRTKPPRYILSGITVPPHRTEVVVETPRKRPRQLSSTVFRIRRIPAAAETGSDRMRAWLQLVRCARQYARGPISEETKTRGRR